MVASFFCTTTIPRTDERYPCPRPTASSASRTVCSPQEDGSLVQKDLWVDERRGVILDAQRSFFERRERPHRVIDLGGNILRSVRSIRLKRQSSDAGFALQPRSSRYPDQRSIQLRLLRIRGRRCCVPCRADDDRGEDRRDRRHCVRTLLSSICLPARAEHRIDCCPLSSYVFSEYFVSHRDDIYKNILRPKKRVYTQSFSSFFGRTLRPTQPIFSAGTQKVPSSSQPRKAHMHSLSSALPLKASHRLKIPMARIIWPITKTG